MSSEYPSDFDAVLDRRSFTKLAGVSGAAMLGGVGSAAGATDSTTSEAVTDVTVQSAAAMTMGPLHWNPAYVARPNIWGRWLTFDRLAQFNLETREWIPRLAERWSAEGDTFTVTIRDDATWSNGDPITSDDLKTHLLCSMAAGGPLAGIIESFDTSLEKKLVITATSDLNPKLFEFNVLTQLLQAKDAEPYAGWANSYWNEDKSVASKITDYKPDSPDYVSGAMDFVEMTDQYYLLKRNPNYYDAENINFKQYKFTATPGNHAKWRAMQDNEFDTVMSVFTPASIAATFGDNWNEYQFPAYWGFGQVFNHDPERAPHVSDRTVRKAIANAVSREACANNAGPRVKNPAPTPAAIASSVQDEWIDVGGTFSKMQDPNKVPSLMKEAGYSKNSSGVWEHPDRGTATIEIISPKGWTDWEVMAYTVGQQLRDAGFDATVTLIGYGTVLSRCSKGDFQMASRAWLPGNARSSYPYFPLRRVLGNAFSNGFNYPGWKKENQPVEVPAMNGSGTMTVNVRKLLDEIASSADTAANKERIKKLAWVTHQDLPWLPIVTKSEQSFINNQNLTAPAEDADVAQLKWPCMYLPKVGKMQWKGDEPTVEDYAGSDGTLSPSEVMSAKRDYVTGDISLELAVSVMRRFFFG